MREVCDWLLAARAPRHEDAAHEVYGRSAHSPLIALVGGAYFIGRAGRGDE